MLLHSGSKEFDLEVGLDAAFADAAVDEVAQFVADRVVDRRRFEFVEQVAGDRVGTLTCVGLPASVHVSQFRQSLTIGL